MSIAFDAGPPVRRQGRRAVSAPSLLNRIQKPPLLDRLSRGQQPQNKDSTPVYVFDSYLAKSKFTPFLMFSQNGAGPIRNRPRAPARAPKKPVTAEDLDKELDAFMKDDNASTAPVLADNGQTKPTEDVDMAAWDAGFWMVLGLCFFSPPYCTTFLIPMSSVLSLELLYSPNMQNVVDKNRTSGFRLTWTFRDESKLEDLEKRSRLDKLRQLHRSAKEKGGSWEGGRESSTINETRVYL